MKIVSSSSIGRITLIPLAVLIFSCAAVPPKPPPERIPEKAPVKDPFSGFPERYRRQAIEYEKENALPRALQCWEIVKAFSPDHEEAASRTAALRTQIQALGDQHFKKGVSYYKANSIPAARREFLLTLYYNPDHTEVLSYLKDKLTEEDYSLYEVKPGDTLKEIARKIYNDPQKDFLIAYFNNLGKDPTLMANTILRLPILEGSLPKSRTETKETKGPEETKEMMGKAVASFKANKFVETISISEEVLLYDPSDKEARDLINASYYQMGKALSQEKKYQQAIQQLNRVDPEYRDVKELIVSVKNQLAEVHYVNGIKYFTEEKLDKAIQEWEETMKLNPRHPKAKGDMESATKLLQKLKEIK